MAKSSSKIRITEDTLRLILVKHLPKLLEKEPMLRDVLARFVAEKFADKKETEENFRETLSILKEHSKILAEHSKSLEEHTKRLEELSRRLEEQNKRLEEQNKRLEEHNRILEEHTKRLEELSRRLEEHSKRLEEHSKILEELMREIKGLKRSYDKTLSALGARWGLYSERSFREGMKAILEDDFGVKVERYLVKDTEGKIFGRPDQVELDLIIKDGKVLVVEIKSSASKADVFIFWKKVQFFEEKEGRKADRMILISPMVEPRALDLAKTLGIEIYTGPEEVVFEKEN